MSLFKNQYSSKNENRRRRVPLIRSVIFIAAVAFIWKSAKEHTFSSDQDVQKASLVQMLDPLDRKIEDALNKPISYYIHTTKHSLKVKSGDSFSSILSEYDISRDKSNEIYKLLKPLGLTNIFPGDSVVVHKNNNGNIEKFSILSKSLYWYEINWTDSTIKAHKNPIEISTYICLLNGVLKTSLSEQMDQAGVGNAVTGKFADIFGWDINFFTDPRKGDIFQIIFEKKFAEGKFIGYGEILSARYKTSDTTFYAFGIKDRDGMIKYYDENGKAVQKQFLKAPLRFSRISSGYTLHRMHPVLGIIRPHLGIDYAAPTGTPVSAAADGKVYFAGRKGGFGNHGNIVSWWII